MMACVRWAVPVWASIAIALMALLLVVCCCGCLCKLCLKRRKDRGFRKGLKSAVDFRSIQILGSTLKDKVCTSVNRFCMIYSCIPRCVLLWRDDTVCHSLIVYRWFVERLRCRPSGRCFVQLAKSSLSSEVSFYVHILWRHPINVKCFNSP